MTVPLPPTEPPTEQPPAQPAEPPTAPPARPLAGAADVELRVPADGAYVSVLRSTTTALAARLEFTIDDLEDLRIAVGEAAALVVREADEAAVLTCTFHLRLREVVVTLTVPSAAPAAPDDQSFAWQVLTTLATGAEVEAAAGSFGVRVVMASSLDPAPAVAPTADAGTR